MARKRTAMPSSKPYPHNDAITVYDTYTFKGNEWQRGQEIRIKNMRGTFTFYSYGKNEELGTEWVTVLSKFGGSFHSFRPEKIKDIVRPKAVRKRRVKSVG